MPYSVTTPVFEGPFDLLLHLILREQVDIYEVSLSTIVVPPAVSTISDYDLKYQIILHIALAQPGITYIGSPNPSTFIRLLDVLNRHREMLLRSLATGVSSLASALDPSLQPIVARRMPAMPERAARTDLRQRLARRETADDMDGRQLRHCAGRAPEQASGQHPRHGAGLSGHRGPRNDPARSRNAPRAAGPPSHLLRVRRAVGLGP